MSELIFPENFVLDKYFVSKVKCFIECPAKYYWTYVRGMQSKYVSYPLFIGSVYHHGLEMYFRGDMSNEQVLVEVHRFMEEFLEDYEIPEWQKLSLDKQKGIAVAMVEGYINWDGANEFDRVIQPWPGPLHTYSHVEQSFEYTPFEGLAPFTGTIDLIGDMGDKSVVIDHKALGILPPNQKQLLSTDFQVMVYMDAARNVFKKNIVGAIYNVALKPSIRQKQSETPNEFLERVKQEYLTQPEKYFHRVFIEYTPGRVERAMRELKKYAVQMAEIHKGIRYLKEHVRMEYPASDAFVKNFTSCFKYGSSNGCSFRSLCEYDRVGNCEQHVVQFRQNIGKDRGKIIYG